MVREVYPRTIPVEPPPETKERLGMAWKSLQWFSYPSLVSYQERTGLVKEVNIFEQVRWALKDNRMRGVVQSVDSANGCLTQCDTCARNSPKTSLIFSRESWDMVWQIPLFRNLFDRQLRWGDCADPSDHGDVVQRAQVVLKNYPDLHNLEMLVNFRKYKSERLIGLIDLLGQYQQINLCISLPLNKNRQPQEDFLQFSQNVLMARDIRMQEYSGSLIGQVNKKGRLEIKDLSKPNVDVMEIGRIVDKQYYPEGKKTIDIDPEDFIRRGDASVILTSEGFFVKVAATRYQSYTALTYTPLNQETITILQKLPLSSNGYMNWPGGTSVNNNEYRVDYLMAEAAKQGEPFQPKIIE